MKLGDHPILTFTSFDMQTPGVAAKQVIDYFGKADRDDLDSVTKAYSRIMFDYKTLLKKSTPKELTADLAHAREISKLMDNKRAALIQATSQVDFRQARQCARIAEQSATVNAAGQNPYEVRDRAMAENVKWLADEVFPKQKIVLWAHNGHVGDGDIVESPSMGRHLRKMFGVKLLTLGFGFDHGQIRAKTISGEKLIGSPIEQNLPPAIKGSSESVLRQVVLPQYLLDFRSIPPTGSLGKWLAADNLFREPGARWDPVHPDEFFEPMSLSKTFDGIIFIAESHASKLIPSGPAPK